MWVDEEKKEATRKLCKKISTAAEPGRMEQNLKGEIER